MKRLLIILRKLINLWCDMIEKKIYELWNYRTTGGQVVLVCLILLWFIVGAFLYYWDKFKEYMKGDR